MVDVESRENKLLKQETKGYILDIFVYSVKLKENIVKIKKDYMYF